MPGKYRIQVADRLRKYGERTPNGCLLWTGVLRPNGYGQISIGNRTRSVHVIAHQEWIGPIPPGHQVHHLCDVQYAPGDITYRRCFEPTHLTDGTPKRNSEHMVACGRVASGDRNPARLHPEIVRRGNAHHARLTPDCMARGEQHGVSVLTETLVREIRHIYATTRTSYRRLALQYGVGTATIREAIIRRTWAHVD